jgi:hypothetical protein
MDYRKPILVDASETTEDDVTTLTHVPTKWWRVRYRYILCKGHHSISNILWVITFRNVCLGKKWFLLILMTLGAISRHFWIYFCMTLGWIKCIRGHFSPNFASRLWPGFPRRSHIIIISSAYGSFWIFALERGGGGIFPKPTQLCDYANLSSYQAVSSRTIHVDLRGRKVARALWIF